jgi:hypothetical protein
MNVSSSNVVAFPRQIRVAPVEAATEPVGDVVDHDGRAYDFTALIRDLPVDLAQRVMDQAPRSAQAFWDMLVRLFPQQATRCVSRIEEN